MLRLLHIAFGFLILFDLQPQSTSLLQDALAGRNLVEAAARRFGGEAALNRIERVRISMQGEVLNGLQGFDPANIDRDVNAGMAAFDAHFDFVRHQYRSRLLQVLPGNIELDAVTYYRDGQIITHYPNGRHIARRDGPESAVADGLLRFVPALFVQRAAANIASATLVGEYADGNQRIGLVDISNDAPTRSRAHITMDDGRLVAIEAAVAGPLVGDDRAIYRFEGEQMIAGMPFPTRVRIERRGLPYIRFNIGTVSINASIDPSLFTLPSDEPLQDLAATNPLGGGAYEITGLDGGRFRVIFFDLGDGVAVFDAPESRARSKIIEGEIQKTLGNKPIKYLILSHFHDDHVAGVGYYVDRGAQIVTAPENAAVVARYAVVNSRLRPDLDTSGKRPSFLLVTGDRVVLNPGSSQPLEIRKLPDCPHAKGMLVAVLPSEKLLVQADLYVELAGPSDASADLLRWLGLPKAPQIDWIVGTHFRKTARERLRTR